MKSGEPCGLFGSFKGQGCRLSLHQRCRGPEGDARGAEGSRATVMICDDCYKTLCVRYFPISCFLISMLKTKATYRSRSFFGLVVSAG